MKIYHVFFVYFQEVNMWLLVEQSTYVMPSCTLAMMMMSHSSGKSTRFALLTEIFIR